MVKTTYQKKNGEFIDKITCFNSTYKTGETNGYGWKVIDVKYLYNNKYRSLDEYYKLLDKSFEKDKRIMQFKKNFINLYNTINHVLGFLILFKVLENMVTKVI